MSTENIEKCIASCPYPASSAIVSEAHHELAALLVKAIAYDALRSAHKKTYGKDIEL